MLKLEYQGYTVGHYSNHRYSGVTLQFIDVETGAQYYAIFNAELTYSRGGTKSGKAYKKGDRLPDKQFRVSKNHALYKFWLSTGLKLPRRIASLHDYMGNLKALMFTADIAHGEKLKNDTLKVVHSHIVDGHHTDTTRTPYGQATDNTRTRVTDKETKQSNVPQGIEPNLTTGKNNHGYKLISSHGYNGENDALSNPYTDINSDIKPNSLSTAINTKKQPDIHTAIESNPSKKEWGVF